MARTLRCFGTFLAAVCAIVCAFWPEAWGQVLPEEALATPPLRFHAISAEDPVVQQMMDKFMVIYSEEVGRTSLVPEIKQFLLVESSSKFEELHEEEIAENDGLSYVTMEEAPSQQYRVYVLMAYNFKSSMFETRRPYVSVLRVTLDCFNSTIPIEDDEDDDQEEDDQDTSTLSCDVLQHLDMPRTNDTLHHIPSFMVHEIVQAAPADTLDRNGKNLMIDCIETQDLFSDDPDPNKHDQMLVHFIRYRVAKSVGVDCMMALMEETASEKTRSTKSSVLYNDEECFDSGSSVLADTLMAYGITKEHFPTILLVICGAGACIALAGLLVQQHRQRSGYYYLTSKKPSKMPGVPDGMPHCGGADTCETVA